MSTQKEDPTTAAARIEQAASKVDQMFDSPETVSSLPEGLGDRFKGGAQMARGALEETGKARRKMLRDAMEALNPPPNVFLPSDVVHELQHIRGLLDTARRAPD